MESVRIIRSAEGKAVTVAAIVVAMVMGVVGLAVEGKDFSDGVPFVATKTLVAPREAPVAEASASETWKADESAQGTRPDAAH